MIIQLIWLFLILLVAFVVLGILYWTGVIKSSKKNDVKPHPKPVAGKNKNYIAPRDFRVGLTPRDDYRSANLCNHKVLYPLNMLDVKYGLAPIPDNCPCLQFIRPP